MKKETFVLSQKELEVFNRILNITLKDEYKWFNSISIVNVKLISIGSASTSKSMVITGDINIDSDWVGKQWREYNYSNPYPDEGISLGDIVGGSLATDIKKTIIHSFNLFYGFLDITFISFNNLMVNRNEMNESLIRKIIREELLNEVRVPRNERREIYKDDNIIVVQPLTHRALQKYAHKCQWCINDDKYDWEEYHKGHAVIIQRNPRPDKKGITGMETYGEIFLLQKLNSGLRMYTFKDIKEILGYDFESEDEALEYLVMLTDNINNFATNIVYYHPNYGTYDMEDNHLEDFNYEITDVPNITPEIKQLIDKEISKYEVNLNENDNKDDYTIKKEKWIKNRESFQKLVDNSIQNLKDTCQNDNDEDNEYVSFYACDFIDTLTKVEVVDVKKHDKHLSLLIVIKYKSYSHMDETPFVNELRDELRKYVPKITIEVEDTQNNFPQHLRQW